MFNNLLIKSKISGTYSVDFITDLSKGLSQINENKSIFIIDKNVLDLFSESFMLIKSSSRLVIIESGEKNKTIEYCQWDGEHHFIVIFLVIYSVYLWFLSFNRISVY